MLALPNAQLERAFAPAARALVLLLLPFSLAQPPADGDVVVAPPYVVDKALTNQSNPSGRFFSVVITMAQQHIFNGSDATLRAAACDGPTPGECCHKQPPVDNVCAFNAQRTVQLYVPHSYLDGDAAPLLVMNDGPGYLTQVAFALDNLVAAAHSPRLLPAFVAVSIPNGGCDAIGSERGLEYDTMSDRYARFVSYEVLPAVLRDPALRAAYPGIRVSDDSDRRAMFGCSSGGAAALSAAYFRPDLFRRVIAYSATLVDQQDHADPTGAFAAFPQGAWGYHSGLRLLETAPKPLRVFHSASEFDLGYNLSASAIDDRTPSANNTQGDPNAWTDMHHNWLVAGNRTAAALKQAGYRYRHVYALGAHHCDGLMLLSTLADTLTWLWAGVA